jgi:hypothetical protein
MSSQRQACPVISSGNRGSVGRSGSGPCWKWWSILEGSHEQNPSTRDESHTRTWPLIFLVILEASSKQLQAIQDAIETLDFDQQSLNIRLRVFDSRVELRAFECDDLNQSYQACNPTGNSQSLHLLEWYLAETDWDQGVDTH